MLCRWSIANGRNHMRWWGQAPDCVTIITSVPSIVATAIEPQICYRVHVDRCALSSIDVSQRCDKWQYVRITPFHTHRKGPMFDDIVGCIHQQPNCMRIMGERSLRQCTIRNMLSACHVKLSPVHRSIPYGYYQVGCWPSRSCLLLELCAVGEAEKSCEREHIHLATVISHDGDLYWRRSLWWSSPCTYSAGTYKRTVTQTVDNIKRQALEQVA